MHRSYIAYPNPINLTSYTPEHKARQKWSTRKSLLILWGYQIAEIKIISN